MNKGHEPSLALTAGLTGWVLGGVVAAMSGGRISRSGGLPGAIVAVAVGLIATALGGLAPALSRRRVNPARRQVIPFS